MTDTLLQPDILVIGAGSGGLSVAAGAVQMGANVILLEHGEMGGDCLNTGCVPSKALLAAAKHVSRAKNGFGITHQKPQIDPSQVFAHVHDVIAQIAPHDSQERFEKLGVRVIRETGQFIAPNRIRAGTYVIQPKRTVISTGSSAAIPPIPGLDKVSYLTNETVFNQTDFPAHLCIIGGGPIGVEMALAHQRLGSQVTIIDAQTIMGNDDPECVDVVRKSLQAAGITLHENTAIEKIEQQQTDGAVCIYTKDGVTPIVLADKLLIAAGRRPNIATLDLEKAGIKFSKTGIPVDARLRTLTNKSVFAIGDVVENGLQFTHVAGYHAGIVIRNILFRLPAKAKTQHVPWVTYTDPELAHIGIQDPDVPQDGHILTRRYHENDRARAERRTDGLIKIRLDKKGGILGVSIVGVNAGELIQPWALAMSSGLKIKHMAGYIAPYPTLGEMNKHIAGSYYTPKLFSNRTRKIVQFVLKHLT